MIWVMLTFNNSLKSIAGNSSPQNVHEWAKEVEFLKKRDLNLKSKTFNSFSNPQNNTATTF